MVIKKLIRELANDLNENSNFEARELFMYASGMSLTDVIIKGDEEADKETEKKAREYIKRRAGGEPLQYITGFAEFMGMNFNVNKYTLIPRQDTEILVEKIIETTSSRARILDIGTGSGCIGISLGKYIKNSSVVLADISEGALKTALKNAELNNVKAEGILIDILKDIPGGKFDVVVSNPPYIETDVIETLDDGVRLYEPHNALDGGKDGLVFYKRITDIAPRILTDNGILAYEIGYNQGEAVRKIVKEKLGNAEVIKDLCGNDRVVISKRGKNV